MIVFDLAREAKRFKKERLACGDSDAYTKMRLVARYMLKVATYSKTATYNALVEMSKDYFDGMPEAYITKSINDIIKQACEDSGEFQYSAKPITIYKEELDAIQALQNDKHERIAFAFLVYAKLKGKRSIVTNNADVFSMVGNSSEISWESRTKAIQCLSQAGIVKFRPKANSKYRYNKTRSISFLLYSMPILREDGAIAFQIVSPTVDSVMLWYLRYRGDTSVTVKGVDANGKKIKRSYPIANCAGCGCPIIKYSNRKKYCSDCAAEAKQENNKKYAI